MKRNLAVVLGALVIGGAALPAGAEVSCQPEQSEPRAVAPVPVNNTELYDTGTGFGARGDSGWIELSVTENGVEGRGESDPEAARGEGRVGPGGPELCLNDEQQV